MVVSALQRQEKLFPSAWRYIFSLAELVGERERNRWTISKPFPGSLALVERQEAGGREEKKTALFCSFFYCAKEATIPHPHPTTRPRGKHYQPKLLYLIKGGEADGPRDGAPNDEHISVENRIAWQCDTQTDW